MEEARSHRTLWAAILAGDAALVKELMIQHMCANAGPDYKATSLCLAMS